MREIKLVLIHGHAGSGKDTIADYLVRKYDFTKYAYADPIKEFLSKNLGIPLNYFYDQELKTKDLYESLKLSSWKGWTPRKLLQFVGTNLFRNTMDEDFWVKVLAPRIMDDPDLDKIVITDIRFENELYPERFFNERHILQNATLYKIIFQVERPGYIGTVPGGFENHESEQQIKLPKNTITLHNKEGLSDLYDALDRYMEKLL
jgi:hypothetical protein